MLDKLKTELARYPLSAFFAVAIAAPFVFGALTTVHSGGPFDAMRLEHVSGLSASVVGLAALVYVIVVLSSKPPAGPADLKSLARGDMANMVVETAGCSRMNRSASSGRSTPSGTSGSRRSTRASVSRRFSGEK